MRSCIGRIRPTGGYHIARTLQNAQPSEANKLINERDIPAITAPSWSNTSTFRLCKTSIFSTFTSQVWINYVIDFKSLLQWPPHQICIRPHLSLQPLAAARLGLADVYHLHTVPRVTASPWRVTTRAGFLVQMHSELMLLHYSISLIHILKSASSFNVASTLVWLKPTLNWRRTINLLIILTLDDLYLTESLHTYKGNYKSESNWSPTTTTDL